MDEAFYVVNGTFSLIIGGKLDQLSPGAFVFIPRSTPHAQGNASLGEVKIISFSHLPGGSNRRATEQNYTPSIQWGLKRFQKKLAVYSQGTTLKYWDRRRYQNVKPNVRFPPIPDIHQMFAFDPKGTLG